MHNRVAIVLPYHNDTDHLLKTVFSIVQQSHINWKLFIVNDGSDFDKRPEAILPTGTTERIAILYQPNGGVSSARNLALNQIFLEGGFDFIAYCDADDTWEEHYLATQVDYLNIANLDLSYATTFHRFESGEPAIPYGIAQYDAYPGYDAMKASPFIFISSVVHRVECAQKVGFFDNRLDSIEDWDYWLRIAKEGFSLGKNTRTFVYYTVKGDGMASQRTPEKLQLLQEKHQ